MPNPTSKKNPPFLPGHWFWGNTFNFAKDTRGFIEELSKQYPEGIVHTKIGFRDFYIILKPEYIQHILQKEHSRYQKSFAYDGLKDFLGKGLLTSEGDFWLKQRRTIQPGFHRKQLSFMANAMVKRVGEYLVSWEGESTMSLNMQHEMLALTRDLVSIAIFGKVSGSVEQVEAMGDALAVLRTYANNKMKNPFKAPLLIPTSENIAFRKAQKIVREFIDEGILEAQKHEYSLVNMLLNGSAPMSKQQLYDELLTLYIAGQETTTNALCFLFYLLSINSKYLKKLKQELKDFEPFSDYEQIKPLKICRQMIQESLRLYPPAWAISRQCVEEDEIDGYTIPRGTTVFLSIYAMHRHPDYWNEPETFLPERFVEKISQKTYMPFGLGPRICIGNELALMEMQIIVAMVYQKFSLKYKGNEPLELITPMTLAPKEKMEFEIC